MRQTSKQIRTNGESNLPTNQQGTNKMNKQEQNYFADLRTPKKGENLHDQDRFRHEVMERIIESRQLQAEPKRYRRVTDWDKVASFAFGLFTVALFIFWLFVGGVK
jgi:hypothetical protein